MYKMIYKIFNKKTSPNLALARNYKALLINLTLYYLYLVEEYSE
jgi:hypothetical protein